MDIHGFQILDHQITIVIFLLFLHISHKFKNEHSCLQTNDIDTIVM